MMFKKRKPFIGTEEIHFKFASHCLCFWLLAYFFSSAIIAPLIAYLDAWICIVAWAAWGRVSCLLLLFCISRKPPLMRLFCWHCCHSKANTCNKYSFVVSGLRFRFAQLSWFSGCLPDTFRLIFHASAQQQQRKENPAKENCLVGTFSYSIASIPIRAVVERIKRQQGNSPIIGPTARKKCSHALDVKSTKAARVC